MLIHFALKVFKDIYEPALNAKLQWSSWGGEGVEVVRPPPGGKMNILNEKHSFMHPTHFKL